MSQGVQMSVQEQNKQWKMTMNFEPWHLGILGRAGVKGWGRHFHLCSDGRAKNRDKLESRNLPASRSILG